MLQYSPYLLTIKIEPRVSSIADKDIERGEYNNGNINQQRGPVQ
jgi:hypothetical protein